MLKNDFPFIRMVILIQQLDKKRVKIGGRNLRSKFLKIFGSGSKSELKYHLFRVQIDGKRLCLQEKGLEIVKNSDFRGQNLRSKFGVEIFETFWVGVKVGIKILSF